MKTPETVDFLGNVIKVGDKVVYPVRRRSDMVLKSATVCETPGVTHGGVACFNETGRRIIIRQPERCVNITALEERHADV